MTSLKNATRLAAICALALSTAQAAPIDDAEQALQARQYETAITHLERAKPGDYPSYLKAVALYQSGNHAAAAVTCEELLKQYPDSPWRHKARFLVARALIAQKNHKSAESILADEAGRIFSSDRKQAIASVLVDFADKLARRPDPNELDALPADERARALRQLNFIGEDVETTTPWIVARVLTDTRQGNDITWLTTGRMLGRAVSMLFSKRDVLSRHGLKV